jgi:3-dehydroquinate dehydratase/shikimate dehydrogenase
LVDPLPICATVLEPTLDDALARLSGLPPLELVELRFDSLPQPEVERLIAASPAPVLATCRPQRQGGLWQGTEAQRLAILRRAAEGGAAWVDVEHDALDELGELPAGVRLLVSRHPPMAKDDAQLAELLASTRHPRAHAQKLAIPVSDAREALTLLRLARAEAKPTIAIGMGFPGVVTRLAGTRAGAPWTYAASDAERPAAPGQLGLARLRALVPVRPGPGSFLYGVIGNPVTHSRSPDLHNAAFARLGHAGIYSWLHTDDVAALLAEAARDPHVGGFSVTIPHKQAAALAPGVVVEAAAAGIGAINTLARSASGWRATNTDATATARLVGEVAGLPVALLGYGGAARASAHALAAAGAQVRVYGRDPVRGRAFARELGATWGGALAEVPEPSGPRLVLNATPLGMVPDVELSPVAPEVFDAQTLAYDLVYTPEDTRFLRDARERGARTITGVEHFVAQALDQLTFWLGEHGLAAEWLRGLL